MNKLSLNNIEIKYKIIRKPIAQIGESLKKMDDNILEKFDLLKDKQGAYYTRNYIVHDYEGVNLAFIENIIRNYLPKLKIKISNLITDLKTHE